ncbi:alpha/beta hydrolase family protein [Nitrospirillum amazonense]|nr:CocE/NonD family hydrolase [Nitrospirillum amazonense]
MKPAIILHIIIAAFIAGFLGGAINAAHAMDTTDPRPLPPAPWHEQVLMVPGDPERPAQLQVTLLLPDGPGPFPLAIMNHGSAKRRQSPKDMPRYSASLAAYYFLSRGYAVLLPMMRGFAGSGGRIQTHGCNLAGTAVEDAKDILAAAVALTDNQAIDLHRIVVAGQSFGGWNSLAFAAFNPPGVKAVINFAGGMVEGDCDRGRESLAKGAAQLGALTHIPSIWFYGDNDSLFPPTTWRLMHERYTEAGGNARLVDVGTFMDDSHQLLSYTEGLAIWVPQVDAFLSEQGLPSQNLHPEYLPTPFPPASGYAAATDVDAVPYLNDKGRELYRQFLTKPLPRAFILAPHGFSGAFDQGFDPIARGLDACRKVTEGCQLYAVDNDVVWTRPTPAPAPSGFATIDNATAVPYLDGRGREGYIRYTTLHRPKAFVIAPDGGWYFSSGTFDPIAQAMTGCSEKHPGCRLYAVDGDVVWVNQATN